MWLGGTGALLLVVAAAVLVALRWDDIAAWAKIAGLVTVNAGVLLAAARLRAPLPATARALDHLGALLVPISVAAITIQVALPWEWSLLLTSAIGGVGAWVLRRSDEPLLGGLAMAAAVPTAGAVGAITGLPSGAILATAALGMAWLAPRRLGAAWVAAVSWAAVAGSVAFVAMIDDPVIRTSTLLQDLGIGPSTHWLGHVLTGVIATAALAILATRDEDEALGVSSIVLGLAGIAGAFANGQGEDFAMVTTAMALAVAFQLVALFVRERRPWATLFHRVASISEAGLALGLVALLPVAFGFVDPNPAPAGHVASSAALAALAWLVADHRRRTPDCQSFAMALLLGGGWWPATVGASAGILMAAAALADTGTPVAVVGAVLAVVLVVSGRPGSHGAAVGAGWTAIVNSSGGVTSIAIMGVVASALAAAASMRSRNRPVSVESLALLGAALLAWSGGAVEVANATGWNDLGWLAWVVGAAVLTVLAERFTDDPVTIGVGLFGRLALVAPFVATLFGFGEDAQLPALALASGLTGLDVMRSGDERLGHPLAVSAPALAVVAFGMAGFSAGEAGISLAVLGAAGAGAIVALNQVSNGWRNVLAGVTAALAATALILVAPMPTHLSTVLMILGGATMVLAIDGPRRDLFFGGAATTVVGMWLRLLLEGVDWAEAYVAPVALLLVLVGAAPRRDGAAPIPSWMTSGAAVALLGGVATIERISGGPGEHALIAGAVAVVAILVGAQQRLLGPLVTGTALIVVVAGHESLAYTASVPTWAWLASAGTVLLGAGITIERTATSPLETGRRALAVIRDTYR